MRTVTSTIVRGNLPYILEEVRREGSIAVSVSGELSLILTTTRPDTSIPPLPVTASDTKNHWASLIEAVTVAAVPIIFARNQSTGPRKAAVYMVVHPAYVQRYVEAWTARKAEYASHALPKGAP